MSSLLVCGTSSDAGKSVIVAGLSFAVGRERQADRLAALIADHADTDGLPALAEHGPFLDLPLIAAAGVG